MRPSKYREDLAEDLAKSRFLSNYFTLHCHSVYRKAELTDLQITSRGVEQLVVRLATRRALQRLMKNRGPNDAKKSQLFSSSSLKLLTIRSPDPQPRQYFHDR